MKPGVVETPKLKRVLTVFSSYEELAADERAYWLSRPASERWEAMELIRRLNHGDEYPQRLQRVLEVAQRPPR